MTGQAIAWTVGGSDTGGGAGIQADLKTMNCLGVHGCSVISAVTAQNTMTVSKIEPVSGEMLRAQLVTLANDLPPRAIKLGLLYSAELMKIVADHIRPRHAFLAVDPVLTSTSGQSLIEDDGLATLKSSLLPLANLVTPNLVEAHRLVGRHFDMDRLKHKDEEAIDEYIEDLAFEILKLGAQSVLLKGGHRPGRFSQDFFTDGFSKFWLTSARLETRHNHGTGCTLSAAIAALVASGYRLCDALVVAKAFVNQGLRCAPNLGQGCGPMAYLGWPETQDDLPWVTKSAKAGRVRTEFQHDKNIGFYPIVDRAALVDKLASAGVRTVQLRVKDLSGDELEHEVSQAIQLARRSDCKLYINDYWRLAVKHRAYGVHLGQDDLKSADIWKLQQSDLRLGISTHSYFEVAVALAHRPSYIAIGPIFATTTKRMPFAPQGLVNLGRWRRTLQYPLVAIGGMFLSNAGEVLAQGVDGIAVVRDLMTANDMVGRAVEWGLLFESRNSPFLYVPVHQTMPIGSFS